MTGAMLAIVNATTDQQRDLVREAWKSDGTRRFIHTLNELVLLSQDECIFEDLEFVLGALDGENNASDDEDGHASNEDEETDGY